MVPLLLCRYTGPQATPNTNRKRGARRVRQNKSPASSRGKTTLHFRQRLAQVVSTATGQTIAYQQINMNPFVIGDRVAAVANAFQRYRLKNLRVKWVGGSATTMPGSIVYGIIDDVDPASTVLTADAVLNLRRSKETKLWGTSMLTYRPVDRNKWYYTQQGTDARLYVQAAFCYAGGFPNNTNQATALGEFDLEGDFEFDGATLVSA